MIELSTLRRDSQRAAPAKPESDGGTTSVSVPAPPHRWKTRVLLPGVILLSAGAVLAYAGRNMLRPATSVRTAAVVAKDDVAMPVGGGVVAQASGWVEPDPFPITVAALADGVVQDVLVLEGQPVQPGQVMVRLIDADAKLSLAKAEADVKRAQAELEAARAALGVGTSQPTPAAAALAETQEELARLPVQVQAAKAKLAELVQESEAKSKAAADGVISPVTAAIVRARTDAQRAEVAVLEATGQVLRGRLERLRVEAEAALGRAEANLAAAQAARAEAALRLERMAIVTPAGGTVMARNVEPGSVVTSSAAGGVPPIRLYDPAKLQVRVDVPLAYAAKVHVGQQAEITVDVLPDRSFAGWVTRVVHEADIQRNTLQFKVAISDPTPQLKPEMLARVKFVAQPTTAHDAAAGQYRLFAPADALAGEPGATVDALVADPTAGVARTRRATLGGRVNGWVEVTDGLRPGDRLIVSPPPGLKDGQRIRIIEENNHGAH